jgi:CubicO group peptidase (beta-lactamase class C family)
MKKIFILLLIPFQLSAQEIQWEKFIDSIVGPNNKPDVPGTMVMIAEDGKVVFQKAYGLASMELKVPLRTDHAIAIGSVSKQFTAIGVLKLVEQGRLKLSDDIRKYFPDMNTHGQVITVENLLTHTSGINSSERPGFTAFGTANGARVNTDDYISFIMSEKLLFPPGTDWSYNNVAYRISSSLIEKISGQPFAEFMKQQVFIPAGMMNTYIATDLQLFSNLPDSYSRGYAGAWRNENRRPLWEWGRGAGNVISTMEDMLKWDVALRGNKVIAADLREKAWTRFKLKNGEAVNYGYGFHVNDAAGQRIISHTGSTYAYNVNSVHIPERKLYIFYGTYYFADPGTPVKRILSRMLNLPFPKAIAASPHKLDDYTGTYQLHHPSSRMDVQMSDRPIYATFTTSGDSLFVQMTEREKQFLRPAGEDQFILRTGDPVFAFNRENGKVTSLTMRSFIFTSAVTEKARRVKIADPASRTPITVKPDLLSKYAGTYYKTFGDDYFFLAVQDGKLYGFEMDIAQKFELIPIAENKFVRKGIEDVSYTFKNNEKGLLILTISGNRTSDYRKVADY